MIALTYGKLEVGLSVNADRNYWTPLKTFVLDTWLHARDEVQQAGMPVVSRHSAHIQQCSLKMWIGDLMQPVGAVSKHQEDVGQLGKTLQPWKATDVGQLGKTL